MATKTPAKTTADKSKANSAFMKPMQPDEVLAKIVGSQSIPRTEVVKKFWDYVKANNLQEPTNKRVINADALLKPIFGKDSATMFEVPGLLGKHLKATS